MLTVEQILEHYRKEFPFEEGVESYNRDRYYWLVGFINEVKEKSIPYIERVCITNRGVYSGGIKTNKNNGQSM